MGWIAMGALILIAFRVLARRTTPPGRALAASFLVHNLLDTSFFYLGITTLALAGGFQAGGRVLGGKTLKLLFAFLAALFAYGLCAAVMTL